MDRGNNTNDPQQKDIISKISQVGGKVPGLPKSTLGWSAGILCLFAINHLLDQVRHFDAYIISTAAQGYAPIISKLANDTDKQLTVIDLKLQTCDALAPKVQNIEITLATLKSTGRYK